MRLCRGFEDEARGTDGNILTTGCLMKLWDVYGNQVKLVCLCACVCGHAVMSSHSIIKKWQVLYFINCQKTIQSFISEHFIFKKQIQYFTRFFLKCICEGDQVHDFN